MSERHIKKLEQDEAKKQELLNKTEETPEDDKCEDTDASIEKPTDYRLEESKPALESQTQTQQPPQQLTETGQYYWTHNTNSSDYGNSSSSQQMPYDLQHAQIKIEYPEMQHFMDIPTSTRYINEHEPQARSRNKNLNRFSYENTYKKVEDHYVCNLCIDQPKKYNSEQTARRHIQLIHFGFRFICTECGLKYMNRRELEKHYQRKHNTMMPNVVETTSYEHPSIYQQIYNNKEHGSRVSYKDSYTKEHNYCICNHCKMVFISVANVVYHIKAYHFRVRFKCEFCDIEYTGRQQLQRHIKKLHPTSQITEIYSDDDDDDSDEMVTEDKIVAYKVQKNVN